MVCFLVVHVQKHGGHRLLEPDKKSCNTPVWISWQWSSCFLSNHATSLPCQKFPDLQSAHRSKRTTSTMPNPNYTQPQSSSTGWFHSVGNFIIPTDELIFFRGVCQPPTSHVCYFNLLHSYWKWPFIIYNGHLPMYPFIIIINPYCQRTYPVHLPVVGHRYSESHRGSESVYLCATGHAWIRKRRWGVNGWRTIGIRTVTTIGKRCFKVFLMGKPLICSGNMGFIWNWRIYPPPGRLSRNSTNKSLDIGLPYFQTNP